MTLWEICLNGSVFSHEYSTIRSPKRAAEVVELWLEKFAKLGGVPAGQITARRYMTNSIDSYGVKRGG